MSEPFIVHAHIPKTGGSALNRRFLFPRNGEARVYQLYRYVFESASRLPLRHVSRAMRSFAATGHVPFGFFDRVYPEAVYVSVFREPEARFLSFVNFVLARPDHKVWERLPRAVLTHAGEDPDALVHAILDDPRLVIVQSNVQTRLAGGMARLSDRAAGPEELAAARTNLASRRYLAGDQGDLDGFIARLEHTLPVLLGGGLAHRTPTSARLEKRLGGRVTPDLLTSRTRERLRDANALDLALYDLVQSRGGANAIAVAA